jgi:prepilin-type N-terminal cleavage/methylation domain-containing protein
MRGEYRGFSLLEILLVLSMIGILLCLALPQWQRKRLLLQQAEARLALEHNARFLERWMLEALPGNSDLHAWPVLPVTETAHYRITFGSREEHTPGRYRLLAVRKDDTQRRIEVYLRLNQNGYIAECIMDLGRERCDDE